MKNRKSDCDGLGSIEEFKTYKRRGKQPGTRPKSVGLSNDERQVYSRRGKRVKDSMEKVRMLGIMDSDILVEGGSGNAYKGKEVAEGE